MQIKDTVAIVTGGAGGIGQAFCVALLENGAASVSKLNHMLQIYPAIYFAKPALHCS
jgi:FlaA1/EpsC-like NDP-sugar epimerase